MEAPVGLACGHAFCSAVSVPGSVLLVGFLDSTITLSPGNRRREDRGTVSPIGGTEHPDRPNRKGWVASRPRGA